MYSENAKKHHARVFPGYPVNENDPDYDYTVRYENWA